MIQAIFGLVLIVVFISLDAANVSPHFILAFQCFVVITIIPTNDSITFDHAFEFRSHFNLSKVSSFLVGTTMNFTDCVISVAPRPYATIYHPYIFKIFSFVSSVSAVGS